MRTYRDEDTPSRVAKLTTSVDALSEQLESLRTGGAPVTRRARTHQPSASASVLAAVAIALALVVPKALTCVPGTRYAPIAPLRWAVDGTPVDGYVCGRRKLAKTAVFGSRPVPEAQIQQEKALVNRPAVNLELPAARHPVSVYLSGLAPSSRRTMRACLRNLARIATAGELDVDRCPWWGIDYAVATALRQRLEESGAAPATRRTHMAALRGVLRACWRLGLMDAEQYYRAVDLAPVRGTRPPAGRALEEAELLALVRACRADERLAGLRDEALILTLYGTSMRRAELCALNLSNWEPEARLLRVRRKGDHVLDSFVAPGIAARLTAWVSVRGTDDGPLFHPINRHNRILKGRLSPNGLVWILRKRARQARIAHVSPHDLRRTAISIALDRGVDLALAQRIAGHADPATTARYDRRPARAHAAAAAVLDLDWDGAAGERDA